MSAVEWVLVALLVALLVAALENVIALARQGRALMRHDRLLRSRVSGVLELLDQAANGHDGSPAVVDGLARVAAHLRSADRNVTAALDSLSCGAVDDGGELIDGAADVLDGASERSHGLRLVARSGVAGSAASLVDGPVGVAPRAAGAAHGSSPSVGLDGAAHPGPVVGAGALGTRSAVVPTVGESVDTPASFGGVVEGMSAGGPVGDDGRQSSPAVADEDASGGAS